MLSYSSALQHYVHHLLALGLAMRLWRLATLRAHRPSPRYLTPFPPWHLQVVRHASGMEAAATLQTFLGHVSVSHDALRRAGYDSVVERAMQVWQGWGVGPTPSLSRVTRVLMLLYFRASGHARSSRISLLRTFCRPMCTPDAYCPTMASCSPFE
jgi:hypothetical protein